LEEEHAFKNLYYRFSIEKEYTFAVFVVLAQAFISFTKLVLVDVFADSEEGGIFMDRVTSTDNPNEIEIVHALRDSIELLRKENSRQRKLIGRLRKTVSDLRRLKNIQLQNDAEFMAMCEDII
jgi:hypothetical protein